MKRFKTLLCAFLVFTLLLIVPVGCSETEDDGPFTYSKGIDENGFWNGVKALEYAELLDYKAIQIPEETHKISDEKVQSEIEGMLKKHATTEQITDRAVADKDTVNIDFVGSVDGVEFSGGNTEGAGEEVIIGVTNYIDDFLEQLIGHMPGETINVEVTFPDDYGTEGSKKELNGKDAVFVTTINHIVNTINPELTDEFVSKNLTADYGWKTVKEMKDGIYAELQKNAIQGYIRNIMVSDTKISSVPNSMVKYQKDMMIDYYTSSAEDNSMILEDYLMQSAGVSTIDELVENNQDDLVDQASYFLVAQAIAEDTGTKVSDEDVKNFFVKYFDTDDYSKYEENYGMPYLRQTILCQMILDYLTENAVLSEAAQ